MRMVKVVDFQSLPWRDWYCSWWKKIDNKPTHMFSFEVLAPGQTPNAGVPNYYSDREKFEQTYMTVSGSVMVVNNIVNSMVGLPIVQTARL